MTGLGHVRETAEDPNAFKYGVNRDIKVASS